MDLVSKLWNLQRYRDSLKESKPLYQSTYDTLYVHCINDRFEHEIERDADLKDWIVGV